MSSQQSGRRRFLKESAAMAGLAVGAVRSASAQASPSKECEENGNGDWGPYGHRSHYVTAVRTGTNGHYGSDVRPGVPRDYGFRTPRYLIFPSSKVFIDSSMPSLFKGKCIIIGLMPCSAANSSILMCSYLAATTVP